MRVTDRFVFFFTYQDMFSNFYLCRNKIPVLNKETGVWETRWLRCSESVFMYYKAQVFKDQDIMDDIIRINPFPSDVKKLGRKIKGFDDEVWGPVKYNIMVETLLQKVMNNKDILNTALPMRQMGLSFVEASPYDKVWGCGLGENDIMVEEDKYWPGQNLLGKAWDEVLDMYIYDGVEFHAKYGY